MIDGEPLETLLEIERQDGFNGAVDRDRRRVGDRVKSFIKGQVASMGPSIVIDGEGEPLAALPYLAVEASMGPSIVIDGESPITYGETEKF